MTSWGRIAIGTRLGKFVDPVFVKAWSLLITQGLRPGDAWMIEEGKIAHKAANDLVRRFLKSDCDSICFIDSDADFGPRVLSDMRDYEEGQQFDALQAFHTRRGWPPEAIWFKRNAHDELQQCLVYGEDTTQPVALVGTHFLLVRRPVFETLRAAQSDVLPERFEWFYYPRHVEISEDAAFSIEAAAFFKLAATTHVKVGHISRVVTGWETYQEFLELGGQNRWLAEYKHLVTLIAAFTGEDEAEVEAKAMRGGHNVAEAWAIHQPETPDEVRAFYGAIDNGYLYDLLNWNSTPFYHQIVAPLENVRDKRALIVGGGLGNEATRFDASNQVEAFELPGVLCDFCATRPDRTWVMLEGRTLIEALAHHSQQFDLIVAIDVLEHIHPDEFEQTLCAMLTVLRPHGTIYVHNNFGQQDVYAMHYDQATLLAAWLKANDLKVIPQGVGECYERNEEP